MQALLSQMSPEDQAHFQQMPAEEQQAYLQQVMMEQEMEMP